MFFGGTFYKILQVKERLLSARGTLLLAITINDTLADAELYKTGARGDGSLIVKVYTYRIMSAQISSLDKY